MTPPEAASRPVRAKSRPAWLTTANALIIGGVILLLGSGASVARGAIARDAARTRWAELEAQRAVSSAHAATSRVGWTPARGAPVARLMIPRLALDEVVVEGIGDAELRAGPGHMTGSVLPGGIGNSVISAHRDRHFRPLAKLVVGDTIVTQSDAGTVTWSVTRLIVVNADAPALRESPQPRLTLTTCWPISYFGTAPDRLIVEAERVAPRANTGG